MGLKAWPAPCLWVTELGLMDEVEHRFHSAVLRHGESGGPVVEYSIGVDTGGGTVSGQQRCGYFFARPDTLYSLIRGLWYRFGYPVAARAVAVLAGERLHV